MMSSKGERIVVAGTGIAGLRAAERLRENGFTGQLIMIGDEAHRPYNRTPLSKALLTGHRTVRDLALHAREGLNAKWRTGAPITGLDIPGRKIILDQGAEVWFDRLVITTGVRARHLPGAPMHSPHVWTLRSLEDARAIDRAMAKAKHVAVIGGGFIGCEIASTARERGLAATIIDRSPTLLHRSLGAALGADIGDVHREAGVRLHLGVAVTGWTEHSKNVTLELDDGERVTADLVVVGIGTEPATGWLAGSGLNTADGVLCGADCHVLDPDGNPVEGIVAAGDVARWPNQRFDTTPRRVEHWINAIEMGQAAADSLLAGTAAAPYTPVPRFWSHQHGLRIQSSGMPSLGTKMTIVDGSVDKRRFVAGFTRTGPGGPELIGAVALDAPRALMRWHERIGHHLEHAPAGRAATRDLRSRQTPPRTPLTPPE